MTQFFLNHNICWILSVLTVLQYCPQYSIVEKKALHTAIENSRLYLAFIKDQSVTFT